MNTTTLEGTAAEGTAATATRSRLPGRGALATAGLLLALGTALGAFGAHGLQARLPPDRLAVYETAVMYHIFNALGLLGVGLAMRWLDSRLFGWAAWLIFAGILLFSGSIYAIIFGAPRSLGMVTPFGGLALMAGWTLFAVTAWRGASGRATSG